MAKVVEEVIVIKLSKLVKHTDGVDAIASDETVLALEQVAQELVGAGVIVEAEKA
jgi:hypothetical protein